MVVLLLLSKRKSRTRDDGEREGESIGPLCYLIGHRRVFRQGWCCQAASVRGEVGQSRRGCLSLEEVGVWGFSLSGGWHQSSFVKALSARRTKTRGGG